MTLNLEELKKVERFDSLFVPCVLATEYDKLIAAYEVMERALRMATARPEMWLRSAEHELAAERKG